MMKHPEAVEQKHLPTQGQVKITDAFSAATKMPNSSKRAKELTDAIGYFIAKDMQPVSVVQGTGFQYMVRTLEPRFQIPHRKTFMDRVLPSLYLKVKDNVMPCTAAAEWFTITTDCWTTCRSPSMILSNSFLPVLYLYTRITKVYGVLRGSGAQAVLSAPTREDKVGSSS